MTATTMTWEGFAVFQVHVARNGALILSAPTLAHPRDRRYGVVRYVTQCIGERDAEIAEVWAWPDDVRFAGIEATVRDLWASGDLPFGQASFEIGVTYEYDDAATREELLAIERGEMYGPDTVQPRGYRHPEWMQRGIAA